MSIHRKCSHLHGRRDGAGKRREEWNEGKGGGADGVTVKHHIRGTF